MAAATWSTQQLAEFVAAVSAAESEAAAALAAVERAAEALDADVAAIVVGGEVVAAVGYPRGAAPVADLEAVKPGVAGCRSRCPASGRARRRRRRSSIRRARRSSSPARESTA